MMTELPGFPRTVESIEISSDKSMLVITFTDGKSMTIQACASIGTGDDIGMVEPFFMIDGK